MSFLESYLKSHRLNKMPNKHKANLKKLENNLNEKVQGSATFEECLKNYGPEISDLVERASNTLRELTFSLQKIRVVINIGTEVYQIVDQVQDCIISEDMSEPEKKTAKLEFGKDLIYFVWMTIDPLQDHLKWLPFKKIIERKLVKWLAGYSLEAAFDMFKAQTNVQTMSAKTSIMRAL